MVMYDDSRLSKSIDRHDHKLTLTMRSVDGKFKFAFLQNVPTYLHFSISIDLLISKFQLVPSLYPIQLMKTT